jgi:ubiquinone/menaquinone biosynthesis C-methylase UbiE
MSSEPRRNVDGAVVRSFGQEWKQFDQSGLSDEERTSLFDGYFAVFPWDQLPPRAVGFDAGCGTGRWAVLAAPRVAHLHCVDPSSAIDVAARNLRHLNNCSLHRATIDEMPLADASMDFGYSLGVLHHLPDTEAGLASCVRKLKPGAPFLVYLYYAFDNRPRWFRALWRLTDRFRKVISGLPYPLKLGITQLIAAAVYWPLARIAAVVEACGATVESVPLSAYRHRSFYAMRTDALDRFGTSLERRFTKAEVQAMMARAGLERIRVSPTVPFWCAVGFRQGGAA